MIPKVIHYIWFGKGKKSQLIKHCIRSWKKILPDYEIKEWNEENFDINMNLYCKQAYDKGKYAFAADYARLWILYNYGGIYMDTDTELFKPLDCFLNHKGFLCFENAEHIAFGTVGVEAGNEMIKNLLEYYNNRSFLDPNHPSGIDWTVNTDSMTQIFCGKGLKKNNEYQEIEGIAIYPSIYFCSAGEGNNKYATHHFAATWLPKEIQDKNNRHRRIGRVKKFIRKILGNNIYGKLKQLKKK